MKKKMTAFLLALCCMLALTVPVFGEEGAASVDTAQKVYDEADLFTPEEETELQSRAQGVAENWDMDMVFLTTETTGGMEAKKYAAEFYRTNGFGIGEDSSGIIMIVDMGQRDAQIVTCGKAITIFTDYYIGQIWDNMKGFLSQGEYYQGMLTLLEDVEYYNQEYLNYEENPSEYVSDYQAHEGKKQAAGYVLIAFAASLLIAAVGVFMMKRSHANIRPYTDGRAYLKENSVAFSVNQDTFAGTHTAMTPIPKDDDNNHSGGSWGGGSSTFSSGGTSFGGGGGKF